VVAEDPVRRGDVYFVNLNPTRGREIRKVRPCVIVSPDELNTHLRTFIVAPLTSGKHAYPFRVPCRFQGKSGYIILDQIRTVDRERLTRRMGRLSSQAIARSLSALQEMFAP
jgi:mRNA interferase MazF